MTWQTPRYDEIKMDAEIGSYQEDSESPPDRYDGCRCRPPASPEPASSLPPG